MRVLPDGTVQIRNTKTGEVRTVKPEELGNYGVSNSAYLTELKAQKETEQLQSGIPALSEADKTRAVAKQKANTLLTELENLYYGQTGSGDDISKGRILGPLSSLSATLGFNPTLKTYTAAKETAKPTLARAFGDVGNLSRTEQLAAVALLPGSNATPEEAKMAFETLRKRLDLSAGNIPGLGKKTGNPLTDTLTGNPIINFLLDKAINIGQDVGTGIRAKQTQPQLNKLDFLAKSIEDQAYASNDPQEKKSLLANANMIRSQISGETGNISQSFSKDVTQNPYLRSILGATQIATTAEIPALAKAGINLVKNAPKTIKGIGGKVFTQGAGKAVRNEAVDVAEQAGKVVEGSKISKPLESWAETAKNAHPNKSGTIDKMVETVNKQLGGKSIKPNKLFDLWDEANNGFKATSGDAGRTLEASYHRAVRDVVRKELDKVAPGFEEGTKLIRQGIQRSDLAKNIGRKAGNIAIGAILYKLLFGGGNQQSEY